MNAGRPCWPGRSALGPMYACMHVCGAPRLEGVEGVQGVAASPMPGERVPPCRWQPGCQLATPARPTRYCCWPQTPAAKHKGTPRRASALSVCMALPFANTPCHAVSCTRPVLPTRGAGCPSQHVHVLLHVRRGLGMACRDVRCGMAQRSARHCVRCMARCIARVACAACACRRLTRPAAAACCLR